MISNIKLINYKAIDLIEIYIFGFGHSSILVRLNNSKIWISQYENFK